MKKKKELSVEDFNPSLFWDVDKVQLKACEYYYSNCTGTFNWF